MAFFGRAAVSVLLLPYVFSYVDEFEHDSLVLAIKAQLYFDGLRTEQPSESGHHLLSRRETAETRRLVQMQK